MSLCNSIDTLAMAYLDDELVAEERRELELHLLACTGCKQHVEGERADLELIRKALIAPPAPDMVKARIGKLLDQEDRAAGKATRRKLGSYLLPGSAMLAAAAAVFAFVMVKTPTPDEAGPVTREAVRQQTRAMPLEVQGASTGPWLREHFQPVEPPQFTASGIKLLGGRLTSVSGHDAALLRYLVSDGVNQLSLTAVLIVDMRPDDLSGGVPYRVGDRVLHLHDAYGMPAVTYVDEHGMGYAFTSQRLTMNELLSLVVNSDLIERAQRGQ